MDPSEWSSEYAHVDTVDAVDLATLGSPRVNTADIDTPVVPVTRSSLYHPVKCPFTRFDKPILVPDVNPPFLSERAASLLSTSNEVSFPAFSKPFYMRFAPSNSPFKPIPQLTPDTAYFPKLSSSTSPGAANGVVAPLTIPFSCAPTASSSSTKPSHGITTLSPAPLSPALALTSAYTVTAEEEVKEGGFKYSEMGGDDKRTVNRQLTLADPSLTNPATVEDLRAADGDGKQNHVSAPAPLVAASYLPSPSTFASMSSLTSASSHSSVSSLTSASSIPSPMTFTPDPVSLPKMPSYSAFLTIPPPPPSLDGGRLMFTAFGVFRAPDFSRSPPDPRRSAFSPPGEELTRSGVKDAEEGEGVLMVGEVVGSRGVHDNPDMHVFDKEAAKNVKGQKMSTLELDAADALLLLRSSTTAPASVLANSEFVSLRHQIRTSQSAPSHLIAIGDLITPPPTGNVVAMEISEMDEGDEDRVEYMASVGEGSRKRSKDAEDEADEFARSVKVAKLDNAEEKMGKENSIEADKAAELQTKTLNGYQRDLLKILNGGP